MKNAQVPAKRGRKKIDLSDKKTLSEIKRLSGLGLNLACIAQSLGVSRATILRRKKDSAIFDTAIREGKIEAVAAVSNALFDSATGRNGEKPNVSSMIFFLKNRGASEEHGAWKDRLEQTTNYSVNLADIIGTRKQAISHSTGTLAPPADDALIINNDD